MKTEIVYEDNDILVCYKPAGIPTQTKQTMQMDVESELRNYLKGKPIYVIHRLDQPVEGLLVFGKSKIAASTLGKQLNSDEINKEYYAVVFGMMEQKKGTLINYMKKENNISATAIMKQIIVDKNDKESSKLQHMANLNKFERFLKENNIENSFNNMNLKTFNSYQNYLQNDNKTPNTIKNIIKGTLFPILKKADKNLEIPFKWDNSNLDSFELIKDQSNKEMADNKKVALTEEQVTEIHKFSINKEALKGIYQRQVTNDQVEKFQEVKDMFVLQCFVGQRISDIQKFFNGDNFMDIENNTISIKQKKGGARAIIPILPIAQELLEKYKGKTLKYYKERNS